MLMGLLEVVMSREVEGFGEIVVRGVGMRGTRLTHFDN